MHIRQDCGCSRIDSPDAPSNQAALAQGVEPVRRAGLTCSHAHAYTRRPVFHTPDRNRQDLGIAVIEAARHWPEPLCWQAAPRTDVCQLASKKVRACSQDGYAAADQPRAEGPNVVRRQRTEIMP